MPTAILLGERALTTPPQDERSAGRPRGFAASCAVSGRASSPISDRWARLLPFQDDLGITKGEAIKAHDALARRLVQRSTAPQHVSYASRLGVQADIPGEIDVGRLDQRLDFHVDRQEMCDPP